MTVPRHPILACLAIAVGVLTVSPSLGQQAVFRAGVEVVRLDVLVTNRGRPVTGLTAGDFEVTDNGVSQNVALASTAGGIDVVLALDTSSSVAGERLRHLKEAGRRLVGSLAPEDTITLLTFSDRLALVAEGSSDFKSIANSLERLEAAGRTAVRDAAFAAASLAPQARRSVLVVFTDGADNSSWLSEDAVVESVRRLQVVVYVVADSKLDPRARSFVKSLVEAGGGDLLLTARRDLAQDFAGVLEEFRSRYLLSYTPTGVRRDDGWHRVGVKLRRKTGVVKAREGYYAARGGSSEPPSSVC